jgi:phosphonate transport system ATP-binding protein
MLQLEGVTRRFGAVTAVDNVSLAVPRGQMLGVIGRSGAGKSTLLRMINRLVEPSAGSIRFDGRDVTALKGAGLRAWRSDCAMVFQQFNLVPRLDVLTNVLVGRLHHVPAWRALTRLWPETDKAIALSALDRFDMGAVAAQRAESLSGGQQQRVAIARALVQEPAIILADEPVASLDPRNALLVMEALAEINQRFGITVLVNLHSLDLARTYCERLVGLAAGRLVFDGPPEALTEAAAQALYGLEAAEAGLPVAAGAPVAVAA